MKFALKGITSLEAVLKTQTLGLDYSFDLRPTSFNFIQLKKIKEIIKNSNDEILFTLLFANEKEIMVKELFELVQLDPEEGLRAILAEFTGIESLLSLQQQSRPFIWHYHQHEKIRNIIDCENLKKIVFHHDLLAEYHERGELFGFLGLFKEQADPTVVFELQLNWDTAVIESMFSYFQFETISLELNNKVELSYQKPDIPKIVQHISGLKKMLS